MPFHKRGHWTMPATVEALGFVIAFGFVVTFVALFVGHLLAPSEWLPQTFQALVSNVVFDAVTVIGTAWLLSNSVNMGRRSTSQLQPLSQSLRMAAILRYARSGTLFRFRVTRQIMSIPAAVGLSVLLALICAYASLWFALAFTDHTLTLIQTLRVLLAQSVDGSRWEAGPLFWLSHSTFLPVVVYGFGVLFAWWVRAWLGPVRCFLQRTRHPDINPVGLTARLVALMAAMSGMGPFAIDVIQRLSK